MIRREEEVDGGGRGWRKMWEEALETIQEFQLRNISEGHGKGPVFVMRMILQRHLHCL